MIAFVLAATLAARIAAARDVAAKYIELHKVPVRERDADAVPRSDEILIRYDQILGGVRVYGCQFNLYVSGSNVRVAFNGLRRLPPIVTTPKIGARQAAAIAMRRAAIPDANVKPELVVVPRSAFARNLPSSDRLVWQAGAVFIDAQNGQLIYEDRFSRAPSPLRR